jgi:CDP-glucose 4,6-dehydratase
MVKLRGRFGNIMFNNVYKNRKVLVTGHTGFKGSWLVSWLQDLGADVLGIALEPDTNPSHFASLKLNVKTHICDVRDYEKISSIIKNFKPEIIFHLAAQPLVIESYKSPLYTFETNIIGTANVLEAGKGIDALKAVIAITTDKCYENQEWVWSYRETDRLGGYDPYSASKAAAEMVIASYRNSFFNVDKFGKQHCTLIASARAGNVIGGGDWAPDRLIPDIIRASVANKVTLLRNPQAIRPWQHVLESLSGYLLLGEKLFKGEKTFATAWNFAPDSENGVSVLEVVEKMQQIWPKIKFKKQKNINQFHETHYLTLDSSKARSLLKWKSVWNIDKTLLATMDWYRSFYENKKILTHAQIAEYVKDAKQKNINWAI